MKRSVAILIRCVKCLSQEANFDLLFEFFHNRFKFLRVEEVLELTHQVLRFSRVERGGRHITLVCSQNRQLLIQVQKLLVLWLLINIDGNQDLEGFIARREFIHSYIMERVPSVVISRIQNELVASNDSRRVRSE
jgi:hypothetical protein